jgi:hypothetical protein
MWQFPFVLTRPARTSCHTFEPGEEFALVDEFQTYGGKPPKVNHMWRDSKGRDLITDSTAFKLKPFNYPIMSKNKTTKKTSTPVSSIDLKLPTATIDLQAICANIWYKYHNDKSLSKEDKLQLREVYNEAARAINRINPGTIVIMSDNPKWKPSTPEEGKYIPPSHEHLMQHEQETVDVWLGRIVLDGSENMPPEDFEEVPLPKYKPQDRPAPHLVTPRAAATKAASSAPKKEGGTVAQIIALYESGVSKKDIIEVHGFNKNTVNRQVGEYIKRQQSK